MISTQRVAHYWHTLLERPRLYAAGQGVNIQCQLPRVVVVTGMAGSGKTIACQYYTQQLGKTTLTVELHPEMGHDWSIFQPVLALFGMHYVEPDVALGTTTEPLVVVIDRLEHGLDIDGKPHGAVELWLTTLLRNPALHIVLASRVSPVCPELVRLTGEGQVRVVSGSSLAFTADEAQALWKQRQTTPLSAVLAKALVSETGGLPAAVALACSLGHIPKGGPLPLFDSFVEDLLTTFPPIIQLFLIQTAVLDVLTSPFVEALTNNTPCTQVLRLLGLHGLLQADAPNSVQPLIRQAALASLHAHPTDWVGAIQHLVDLDLATGAYDRAWQRAHDTGLWDIANTIVLKAGDTLRQTGASQTVVDWIMMLPATARTADVQVLLARCQTDVGDLDGALLTLTHLRANEHDPRLWREYTIRLALVHQVRGQVTTADQLIQPFLGDPSLPAVWQARVFRLHAIALALMGKGEEALEWIERSVTTAHAGYEQRVLALAYQDQAAMLGRLGRLMEAEQSLRLAEHCWRQLKSVVDLAVVLNSRAMLALAQRDYAGAHHFAQEARVTALSGKRIREAAVASATWGDVALAQGMYSEAVTHYQVAVEDADSSNYLALRGYSLAMQAQVARLQNNLALAARLLPRIEQHRVESAEQAGWLAAGIAAAHFTLGIDPNIGHLQQALDHISTGMIDVRVALLIMLAQAWWQQHQADEAFATWEALERLVVTAVGDAHLRLTPLAGADPTLLVALVGRRAGRFAQLAKPLQLEAQLSTAIAQSTPLGTLLTVQVLGGTEALWWQTQPVTLPKHGLAVLLVLLTSAVPLAEEDVLARIWHMRPISVHALRRLVVRIHGVMPGVVKQANGFYKFALVPDTVAFDVADFLRLEWTTTETTTLLAWAEAANTGCLIHHTAPWAIDLRRKVNQRLALCWLELGRRAMRGEQALSVQDAFAWAHQADPTSDIVTRAILQYGLESGDRTLVMHYYFQYQHALNADLGIEPASDLELMYRQALEP